MTKEKKDKLEYEEFKKERDEKYKKIEKEGKDYKEGLRKKKEDEDERKRIRYAQLDKESEDRREESEKKEEKENEKMRKDLKIYILGISIIIFIIMPIIVGVNLWGKYMMGLSGLSIVGIYIYFSMGKGVDKFALTGVVMTPFVGTLIVGGIFTLVGGWLGI